MNKTENWMQVAGADLSEENFSLLKRARRTLENNIAVPGENDPTPLPWHPLHGIRPSSTGYPGIWNWDSAFHALAVSRWNPTLAREQVQIFLNAQLANGALPDVLFMNGQVVTNFGKPPVFPWAFSFLDRRNPDDAFLADVYKSFVRYEAFWMNERGGAAEGLFHYDSSAPDPGMRQFEAKLESGWDNSVRFDSVSYDLWPIDLNCFMVMLYRAMREFAQRLKREDEANVWHDREECLVKKINAELWDPQARCYVDRTRSTGEFSKVLSPACFMPLYVGIADRAQADTLASLAASKEHFSPGMPTVSYDNPSFDPGGEGATWRGATWLNVAYFALRGLKNYGYHAVADEGRNTILAWATTNKDAIYERYNSRTGEGNGVKHFGWSSVFIIEFILNWEKTETNL